MKNRQHVKFSVNGEIVDQEIEVRKNLVDFVRQDLGLTGSHSGCEHGACGACTIRVDGQIVRGCLMLAVQCDGAVVETIEGLSDKGILADLQKAFLEHNAAQCGFCSPGMLMTAHELIENGPPTSREQIREFISGNYCRCTGYQAIVDAIEEVAEKSSRSETAE